MSRIKAQSVISHTMDPIIDQATGEIIEPIAKKVVADVRGSKLKAMLNDLSK
jgi:hypothetical protein